MIVFAMALFNTCDHKVTENRTKNPRQNQNMDAEGESLNNVQGFTCYLIRFLLLFIKCHFRTRVRTGRAGSLSSRRGL